MRRVVTVIGLVALFLVSGTSALATERIKTFDVVITVREDAKIDVVEVITYDFESDLRHGIFRHIPYIYGRGFRSYRAEISQVLVNDPAGNPYPFSESEASGELVLKIGDPNKTVTGVMTYVIGYTVDGPFLYGKDLDELYWNVTGDWPIELATVTATVVLPRGVSVLQAACYQGYSGDTGYCDRTSSGVGEDGSALYLARALDLVPGEQFSVALAFPKGVIYEPTKREKIERAFIDYWPFLLPVLTLLIGILWWRARGRDPQGLGTTVTEFGPPENISPALAGLVFDERLQPREITADIVQLAVDGYIRIHHIEKKLLVFLSVTDYLIERLREDSPEDPVASELIELVMHKDFRGTALVDGKELSGTLVSRMKTGFAKKVSTYREHLYKLSVERGFFPARPDRVRGAYVGVGAIMMIVGGVLASGVIDSATTLPGLGILASGVIVLVGGNWMPRKTKRGVETKDHLAGFKYYLRVAEKDRIEYHNAPDARPELFDKYLPFAIAFGVEKEWAKQFEGIYTEPPEWYRGHSFTTFSTAAFIDDVGGMCTSVGSAVMPSSSGGSASGGGGSAGGGFGGGGGGSW